MQWRLVSDFYLLPYVTADANNKTKTSKKGSDMNTVI